MKSKKLPKYKILEQKKEKHKLSKAYKLKQLKKQAKLNALQWRLKVKERDNWTCQICRKYLKDNPHNCHAHHLLDKKNFKQYSLDVNNGITLCYRCHKCNGKSPHLGALYFVKWLQLNKPDTYEYLMKLI